MINDQKNIVIFPFLLIIVTFTPKPIPKSQRLFLWSAFDFFARMLSFFLYFPFSFAHCRLFRKSDPTPDCTSQKHKISNNKHSAMHKYSGKYSIMYMTIYPLEEFFHRFTPLFIPLCHLRCVWICAYFFRNLSYLVFRFISNWKAMNRKSKKAWPKSTSIITRAIVKSRKNNNRIIYMKINMLSQMVNIRKKRCQKVNAFLYCDTYCCKYLILILFHSVAFSFNCLIFLYLPPCSHHTIDHNISRIRNQLSQTKRKAPIKKPTNVNYISS